jgi:hypothetical protein
MITPALGSSWVPAGSSAPTAFGRRSPARSAPPSTRRAGRAGRLSTPTTPAFRGAASSSSSPSGPSPGCSRPTAGRHASGSARPPPTPRRSAAAMGHASRPSGSCWSVRPHRWPSGSVTLAGPRRSRACSASPTSYARRSAPAGHWSGTPATTVTPSPPTASATPSATPSFWPSPSTRHWVTAPRSPPPWPAISSGATGRWRRSSSSPAVWRPIRRCRPRRRQAGPRGGQLPVPRPQPVG